MIVLHLFSCVDCQDNSGGTLRPQLVHSLRVWGALFSNLIQIPFSGLRISSPTGRSSSRVWQASMLKLRRIEAKITFSSITAKRWPAHHSTHKRSPCGTQFCYASETLALWNYTAYRYSCGVRLRRVCKRKGAVLLNFLAGSARAWTPPGRGSNGDHDEECRSPQWHSYLWAP